MEASSRTARTLALAAVVLLAGCKRAPATQPGQPLQPLPPPPAISIAPDAVPTAGLTVVAARPHAVVGADARPTITFSARWWSGLGREQRSLPPPATLELPLPGEWRWIGSASVEFVPQDAASFATRFTVTVPAGLERPDG
jgi:hypothetical protein